MPFDVNRPVDTPTGLNTGSWIVPVALARTVNDFKWVGLPLDTTLRASSYTPYGGKKIPVHGAPGSRGGFNAIDQRWKNTGYSEGGGTAAFWPLATAAAALAILGPTAREAVERLVPRAWAAAATALLMAAILLQVGNDANQAFIYARF